MIFYTVTEGMLPPTSLLTRSLPNFSCPLIAPLPAHCTFAAYTFTPMQILYLAPNLLPIKRGEYHIEKKQSAVHYNGLPFIEATENLLSFVIFTFKNYYLICLTINNAVSVQYLFPV